MIKVVETLAKDPARLAQYRAELEALAGRYFEKNRVRQTFLMTRAVKK